MDWIYEYLYGLPPIPQKIINFAFTFVLTKMYFLKIAKIMCKNDMQKIIISFLPNSFRLENVYHEW